MMNRCIVFFLTAFMIPVESLAAQTLTDVDGNSYKTVTIGKQEWMAENLRVKSFCNGDPIANIRDDVEWYRLKTPSWSYYEHEWKNGETYGLLYNGYAVKDSRGLCPQGWHVPTASEWEEMLDHYGGKEEAGKALKSAEVLPDWTGNNLLGFAARAGGKRLDSGDFFFKSLKAYWWTSGEMSNFYLNMIHDDISKLPGLLNTGASVRCIRSD